MKNNFEIKFKLAVALAICTFVIYSAAALWITPSGNAQGTQYYGPTQTIATGTAAMTTAAITAPACGTTVTVAASNVQATDTITVSFNAAPAGTNAGLVWWPTAGNVNFAYCPGVTETPAAATINWSVKR